MDINLGPIPEGLSGYDDSATEGARRDRRRKPRHHPEPSPHQPTFEELSEEPQDYYEPARTEDEL